MSENREAALHGEIRKLTEEIVLLEDELSRKVLREKLNSLRQQRETLLGELGEIQQARESRREPTHAA